MRGNATADRAGVNGAPAAWVRARSWIDDVQTGESAVPAFHSRLCEGSACTTLQHAPTWPAPSAVHPVYRAAGSGLFCKGGQGD